MLDGSDYLTVDVVFLPEDRRQLPNERVCSREHDDRGVGDVRFAKRVKHPGDTNVDGAFECPRHVRMRGHVLGVRQRSIREHGIGVLQDASVGASVVLPAEIKLGGPEVGTQVFEALWIHPRVVVEDPLIRIGHEHGLRACGERLDQIPLRIVGVLELVQDNHGVFIGEQGRNRRTASDESGSGCGELTEYVATLITCEAFGFGVPVAAEDCLGKFLFAGIDNARNVPSEQATMRSQDVHCERVIGSHCNLAPLFRSQDVAAADFCLANGRSGEAEEEDFLAWVQGGEHDLGFQKRQGSLAGAWAAEHQDGTVVLQDFLGGFGELHLHGAHSSGSAAPAGAAASSSTSSDSSWSCSLIARSALRMKAGRSASV